MKMEAIYGTNINGERICVLESSADRERKRKERLDDFFKKLSASSEWPRLHGTEKQIDYAQDIRMRYLINMHDKEVIEYLINVLDAKYWIEDARRLNPAGLERKVRAWLDLMDKK